MVQLVIWVVLASFNPANPYVPHIEERRFVAAYTSERECDRHAQEANDSGTRGLRTQAVVLPHVILLPAGSSGMLPVRRSIAIAGQP